jgi:hypothetical protein
MHITILRKRYELRFVPFLGKTVMGTCEDPFEPERIIRIKQGMSEKETLDTIIHEILHAADWWKKEEWVENVATDITRTLWRLGYRKCNCEENVDGKAGK